MAPSKKSKGAAQREHADPKYPYTNKPGSLRKFLQLVPNKPKPPKIVTTTLKTWGFTDGNDASILRVLKVLDLLSQNGETTEHYASFMKKDTGPSALGQRIREVYEALFQNFSDPAKATSEELTNFFNIHSGGAEKTIEYQVQTFKALADNARFDGSAASGVSEATNLGSESRSGSGSAISGALHIDLHVHLPENKTRADYDAIFLSIAEHILGRRT